MVRRSYGAVADQETPLVANAGGHSAAKRHQKQQETLRLGSLMKYTQDAVRVIEGPN